MTTIYKYPIRPDLLNLRLPKTAELLCVQIQNGEPQLWVMLDKEQPLIDRRIAVYGTGHVMNDDTRWYIDTFQLLEGSLVFHVFEEQVVTQ